MAKAKDAFRTISEVAEWLDTPTHVLRFWESKFTQIKPVKGAGGRRYYRPDDIDLLGGIKQLLHEDGLTIKGTQKLLREKGAKYVATLGASIMVELTDDDSKSAPVETPAKPPVIAAAPETSNVTSFQRALPFDEPAVADDAPAATGPAQDIPELPTDLPSVPSRILGLIPADVSILQARAAEIAPLLIRLEKMRDRLRA